MKNDVTIRMVRVLASTIIGLVAILAAAVLLYNNVVVPAAWWGIATLAVGGVTGADVIAALVQNRRVQHEPS